MLSRMKPFLIRQLPIIVTLAVALPMYPYFKDGEVSAYDWFSAVFSIICCGIVYEIAASGIVKKIKQKRAAKK